MQIDIPTDTGSLTISLEPGKPVIFLGANGTGKSSLGIYIDKLNATGPSHRIAAQRSLELPDMILLDTTYDRALELFLRDKSIPPRREPSPGAMSYNYDELLMTLFAEYHRTLERAYSASKGKKTLPRPETLIERLQALWNDLIPYQELDFSEGSVRVARAGKKAGGYQASLMSDGERVIFHVLGQALLMPEGGVLIIDEPELHINRALVGRLWDVVERERSDCALVYITHDIDFAVSRRTAQRFAVLDYTPAVCKTIVKGRRRQVVEAEPPHWMIQPVPVGIDLPDEVVSRIVGSRKPILFVEGERGSLAPLIYRQVYDGFTTVPVASCNRVIQLVRSFKVQKQLHWLDCAGLIDRDGRTVDATGRWEEGVYILPVSEVENVFLLPQVFMSLAGVLSFNARDAAMRFEQLQEKLIEVASRDSNRVSLKHTSGRIHEAGRTFGLKAKCIGDLAKLYADMITKTRPEEIHRAFQAEFDRAIVERDHEAILRLYDNKGLLDLAAGVLGFNGRTALEGFIGRTVLTREGAPLLAVLRKVLPTIEVCR